MLKYLVVLVLSLSPLLGCSPITPTPVTLTTHDRRYSDYQENSITLLTGTITDRYVGTGFIFAETPTDYLIMTDRHVIVEIEGIRNGIQYPLIFARPLVCKDGTVTKGKIKDVKVIAVSSGDLDLAVLSITKVDLDYIPKLLSFYDGPPIEIGKEIFSVGSPMNLEGVLSFGRISKYTNYTKEGAEHLYLIADNMGIPGSSGSGLIYEGRVIGIIQRAYSVRLNESLSSKDIIKFLKDQKIAYSTR